MLSFFPPGVDWTIAGDCHMRVARRFLVSGRVQGVGFRFFTEAAASREGLHGWVRNRPDGSVEAWAEGDAAAVERFERALRHGPAGARVDQVEIDDEVPSGRETGFSIR
jgi:acylphosphatase